MTMPLANSIDWMWSTELAKGTVILQILHIFIEQILLTFKKHKNLENNKARKEEGIELK